MAINTEDPEEGTPKSKKDIRRERRQMKEVNRYRKSIGAEPLYSKEERRAVGKIVEPGKSKVMTEADSSAQVKYNDPNKPAEYSEFEYQSREVANQLGRTEQDVPPVNVTKEQYEGLMSDDKQKRLFALASIGKPNNPKEGETLKNTILNPSNATTVTDVIQTKVDNDNTLTLKEKEDLTKTSIVAGNETDKIDKDITNEELQNKSQIQTLTQGPQQYNWTDTYVSEGFTPESPEAILSRAADAARKKAPSLVVEKLGVQDYYPEIGRDIAVGTFTGSRIGSQTIYSGAGGLLPLGLYDARKRAIAADIKKKEALMDQLKEIPDIAKQFKPAFAQDFYEGLQPYLDAYKNNPEGLASDPGFLKYIANKKSVGEDFIKVDAYLRDLEDKIVNKNTGQPAAWVPKGVLEIINNIKSGMVPGKIEDFFSGKKNISKVLNTVRALPNALNQADNIVKELLSKGGVETAINMKTGENFTEKDMAELNTLIQQINSPSPDYEMFAELKRKFFDFEYDKIAEEWVNMHMQDQPESIKNEVKKSMSSYIESQMPEDAIISTITKQANGYTERRGQDLDYQKAMARIQADKEMFYADFNRHTSATRALYEGMERLGSDNESIDITDAGVSDKDGLKMEWEVYNKQTGQVDFVSGATIKANPGLYFKNKADANANKPFVPKSTVYVVPTTVDMRKSGKNYNVSTYGNSYDSFIDLGGGDKAAATPVGVRVRTPYATAVSNGNLNEGPIISSDNAIGSKFQRSAGNVYSGGGKGRTGGGSSSYSRE